MALEKRLRNTTTNLQQWLAKIEHQEKISESLFSHDSVTQMTLHQVWLSLSSPTADCDKFPS
jgi:ABC-type sulfate/molybdate transport systems ATPase subunit